MRKADVYPAGKFMKAAKDGTIDISGNPGALVATIASISTHEFDDGKSQRVLHFVEDLPDLGLNVTNWTAISAFTGKDDDDEWIGAKIEVFVVPEMKSQTGHALRVRKPSAPATPAARQAAPSAPPSNALLVAARRKAWDALKAQFPEKSDQDLTPMWRDVMAIAVPERQPSTFGLVEWNKVYAAITAGTNPVDSAEPAFAADDIPF